MTFFAHMLEDTVTVRTKTGVGTDGAVTRNSTSGVAAKVFESADMVGGDSGAGEDETTGLVLEQEVDKDDIIVLPDGEEMTVLSSGEAQTIGSAQSLYWARG